MLNVFILSFDIFTYNTNNHINTFILPLGSFTNIEFTYISNTAKSFIGQSFVPRENWIRKTCEVVFGIRTTTRNVQLYC